MTVGELRMYLERYDDGAWLTVVVAFPLLETEGYGTARACTDDIVWCPPELAEDHVNDWQPALLLPADLGLLSDKEMMRLWRFFVDWKRSYDYHNGVTSHPGDPDPD